MQDVMDRTYREETQKQAFDAFDLEGSGEISAIDVHPAVRACVFFEGAEVREDDLNWAMKRHGVQRGGVMTLLQFNGICEAVFKRKVEPALRKQLEYDRMRAEAEREEVEDARRIAAQRQQRMAAQQYRTEQDIVARAYYAFDTDDSGEVSGVDLTRMLTMSGLKQIQDNELLIACASMGKNKGSLFTLQQFRDLHAMLSGGDGFGGRRAAPAANAAPIPQVQTSLPAARVSAVRPAVVPGAGQAGAGPGPAPGVALPMDLPPPASAGSVMTTPTVADIEVHRRAPPLQMGATPQRRQEAAYPEPVQHASSVQSHAPQEFPSERQHGYPAPAHRLSDTLPGNEGPPPQQQVPQRQQAQPVQTNVNVMPLPAPTMAAQQHHHEHHHHQHNQHHPIDEDADGSEDAPAGQLQFDLPEGVEAALKHHPVQFLSRRASQRSLASDTAAAAAATAAMQRTPASSPATCSSSSPSQKPPLRKVRVIGDEDRLRGMVEGHPNIATWGPVHATHVGAYAVVLRDAVEKDAIGVRFPDGEVGWYPSACIVEFGTTLQNFPSTASEAVNTGQPNVGPQEVPLTKLFNQVSGLKNQKSDIGPSWPSSTSANSVFAKDHQLLHNLPHPIQLQHHLQHSGTHCNVVDVDEFGDDVPNAAPGGTHPEVIQPSETDGTSLPPSRMQSRYGPPPRGSYTMPNIPKYDITELDTIYPLGRKKMEVKAADITQVFALFDTEGEHEVARTELGTMLRSLGYTLPEQEVHALLGKSGKNLKGKMAQGEFLSHVREVGRVHKRNKRNCDLTTMNSTHARTAADSLRNLFFLFHDGGETDTLSRDQLSVCLNAVGIEDSHEVDIFLEVDRVFGNPNVPRKDARVNLETFTRLIKQLQAHKFTKRVEGALHNGREGTSVYSATASRLS